MAAVRAPSPATRWALAALALYGALLWVTRPATPFEWDEVLYQRALDHYDVAVHSPHPPGVPQPGRPRETRGVASRAL